MQYYRVTISPQLTTKQITGTNITINDLYACTPYTIYVNAVDEDHNDGEMLNMQVKTARTGKNLISNCFSLNQSKLKRLVLF